MSTTRTARAAARQLSLAVALAALTGLTACANATTGPDRDDAGTRAIEPMEPRLDGGDTTGTKRCNHTQTWEC